MASPPRAPDCCARTPQSPGPFMIVDVVDGFALGFGLRRGLAIAYVDGCTAAEMAARYAERTACDISVRPTGPQSDAGRGFASLSLRSCSPRDSEDGPGLVHSSSIWPSASTYRLPS